jgi:hypothetical protein
MKTVYALRVVRCSPNPVCRVGSYLRLISGHPLYLSIAGTSIAEATIYNSRAAAERVEREGFIPNHIQVEIVPFIEQPPLSLRRRKRT